MPNTTQLDMFSKVTKESLLADFCREKGFFSSHDINYYGTTNFYDSATRRIREWVSEGKVKRLDEDEILFRGLWKPGCQHLAWYVWEEK